MTPFRPAARATLAATALTALLATTAPVRADGEFFQVDISEPDRSAVLTIQRGRWAFGVGVSDYDNGTDINASVTRSWQLDAGVPVTLRFGPTLQYERTDRLKAGVKIVAESWNPTGFGHLFLLGEVNSIDAGYFALAQFGLGQTNTVIELSHQGDNDGYSETKAAVAWRPQGGPLALRAGWSFDKDVAFAGFAINTF